MILRTAFIEANELPFVNESSRVTHCFLLMISWMSSNFPHEFLRLDIFFTFWKLLKIKKVIFVCCGAFSNGYYFWRNFFTWSKGLLRVRSFLLITAITYWNFWVFKNISKFLFDFLNFYWWTSLEILLNFVYLRLVSLQVSCEEVFTKELTF